MQLVASRKGRCGAKARVWVGRGATHERPSSLMRTVVPCVITLAVGVGVLGGCVCLTARAVGVRPHEVV